VAPTVQHEAADAVGTTHGRGAPRRFFGFGSALRICARNKRFARRVLRAFSAIAKRSSRGMFLYFSRRATPPSLPSSRINSRCDLLSGLRQVGRAQSHAYLGPNYDVVSLGEKRVDEVLQGVPAGAIAQFMTPPIIEKATGKVAF
jgi:hypothetical protein